MIKYLDWLKLLLTTTALFTVPATSRVTCQVLLFIRNKFNHLSSLEAACQKAIKKQLSPGSCKLTNARRFNSIIIWSTVPFRSVESNLASIIRLELAGILLEFVIL